nr:MAG TPA: hypothetical protein [Bacteriophage sp.]
MLIFFHSFFKFSFCPGKTGFGSFFCDFYKFFTAPPDSYFCFLAIGFINHLQVILSLQWSVKIVKIF